MTLRHELKVIMTNARFDAALALRTKVFERLNLDRALQPHDAAVGALLILQNPLIAMHVALQILVNDTRTRRVGELDTRRRDVGSTATTCRPRCSFAARMVKVPRLAPTSMMAPLGSTTRREFGQLNKN